MIRALLARRVPSRNAARVPGSLTSRSQVRSSSPAAAVLDSARARASSSPVNSSHAAGIRAGPSSGQPSAGRRRMNSAMAACLRAAMWASTRSQAQIAPTSSSSLAPGYRSSGPAASAANRASSTPPGAASRIIPVANAPAGPGYSPGNRSAEPGWPGPRRPRVAPIAASAPVVPIRAASAAARASSSKISRHCAIIAASSARLTSGGPSGSGSSARSGPGSGSVGSLARYAAHCSPSIQSAPDGSTSRHPAS